MSSEELPLTAAPSPADGQQQEIVSEHGEACEEGEEGFTESDTELPKFRL